MPAPPRDAGPPPGRPRGFALAAALFTLVLIAALVGGAFFAARQELRIGLNSRSGERAAGAAEAGVQSALAGATARDWMALGEGDSVAFSGVLVAGSASYAGAVVGLGGRLFLVRATGTDAGGRSERAVGALARLEPLLVRPPGALTVRGSLQVGGAARIDGRDDAPQGWTDCGAAARDTLPGLVASDSGDLRLADCPGQSCISGNPRIVEDSALRSASLLSRIGLTFSDLAALADKTYPAGAVGPLSPAPAGSASGCDRSAPGNWGDPSRPGTFPGCQDYFPVIVAEGDLRLGGGRGQGVLVVRGDLDIEGGGQFVGLVIVLGRIRVRNGGGELVGGVLASNEGGGANSLETGTIIRYSSCALTAALGRVAVVRPLRERSWLELY